MRDVDSFANDYAYWACQRDVRYYDVVIALMPRGVRRVLDAGCGGAELVVRLAPNANWIVGLDASRTMLERARARASESGIRNVSLVHGDLCDLPFESSSFDFVVSTGVLHCVSLEQALPELKSVLRAGGGIALKDRIPPASHAAFRRSQFLNSLRFARAALAARDVSRARRSLTGHIARLAALERTWYASLSPDLFCSGCSRFFPGCHFQQDRDMLMHWQDA